MLSIECKYCDGKGIHDEIWGCSNYAAYIEQSAIKLIDFLRNIDSVEPEPEFEEFFHENFQNLLE